MIGNIALLVGFEVTSRWLNLAQRKKSHPKNATKIESSSEQVFQNDSDAFRTHVTGKQRQVRVNFSKKFV